MSKGLRFVTNDGWSHSGKIFDPEDNDLAGDMAVQRVTFNIVGGEANTAEVHLFMPDLDAIAFVENVKVNLDVWLQLLWWRRKAS